MYFHLHAVSNMRCSSMVNENTYGGNGSYNMMKVNFGFECHELCMNDRRCLMASFVLQDTLWCYFYDSLPMNLEQNNDSTSFVKQCPPGNLFNSLPHNPDFDRP